MLILSFFLYGILVSCDDTIEALPLHNKKVLILGNSITQNGQYVDFLEYYLRKQYPKENLDIISIGLSSETISGDSESNHPFPRPWLHSRLEKALELTEPAMVLACYGMNDGIYHEKDSIRFKNYKDGIRLLSEKVLAIDADLILLTPPPFDPDPVKNRLSYDGEWHSYKNPYYDYPSVLKDYSEWLVSESNFKTININEALSFELSEIKSISADSTFIPDGVHPNTIGHFYMAGKILSDLYPEIDVNTDVVNELKDLKSDSIFVLVSKRRQIRSEGWLDYVGYTKQNTVQSDDIKTTVKKVKALDLQLDRMQNSLPNSN